MKSPVTLCFIFFSIVVSSSSYKVEGDDEVSALLLLKAGLVDPTGQLKDWRLPVNGSDYCKWTGVRCSSTINGAVEKLDLSGLNLSGGISDQIASLKRLSYLNISCNGFSSTLPESLFSLTSLQVIDLSHNSFSGGFPSGLGRLGSGLISLNSSSNNFSGYLPDDLGNATLLESLDFRGNFFEGSIPVSYRKLGNLKFLGLSGNNLTGPIPKELGEISSLDTLVLGYNAFEGGIPAEFGNLTNLRYLDLAVANLGGKIPIQIGNLKMLNTLFLFQNGLEGEIPAEIGKMESLQQLDLSDNMLSGEVPPEISNLKNLELLSLMRNGLSGSIPDGISSLARLEVLELWNNSFSGPLPSDLGLKSPLEWIDVSSNSFSGPIPPWICSQGKLTKLILFNNAFSGPIPPGLSKCGSLVRVRIQNNLLSGTIPPGFAMLGNLQRLEVANNSLSGQIPTDIASSLSFVDLSQNRLQSCLPSSIFTNPSLQNFIASNNDLEGEIPDHFQGCPSLSVLDLSSNRLSGNIPPSISSCGKMVKLNLSNNRINGAIPEAIANMPTLAILDLSNNTLTGRIPFNLGNSPALETLNVSYNNLDGPIPDNEMLGTINPNDLRDNSGLCGGVLPPCSKNMSRHRGLHEKHIVVFLIGISALIAVVVIGFGLRFIYKRWYENGSCLEERLETGDGEWPWRLMAFQRIGFTSKEVLACIKESNVIGKGATGVVYKAEMQRLSTTVAVKKLWHSARDIIEMGSSESEDVVGEVNVLGRLRHRNVVRLLGFLHNDREAMIVYEYMENGSLGEALHCKRLLVDWVSRYNIGVGVAQGLAYLHHDCHPAIIHRDVKSNNILLDMNLEARIADFGLAKIMLTKNETVSMVVGSYGYIAPEYGYTSKVDEKSDIYSYGVVLLELVTGKRPLEPEFGDSVDIVEWMRMKIRDNRSLEEAVDPSVGNNKHVREEMLLVLRIALLCTAKLPKDRPSMRDVLSMLREAKPRRKGSNANDGVGMPVVFSTSPVNGLL
ncbi:unnamed protein product [Cuscuta europaea]|uniref:non-specific serine/threonine protein kinase n=2 Tax=Cuscuta europaea TaxID=41803 RepID=A0A9P1E2G4_CUSEU|nr:unnamed protein product [Cuscuta europaea]